MPHHCVVKGCHSSSKSKSKKLSFHSLPLSKPGVLRKWLSNMMHKGKVSKHMKVCSLHFSNGRRQNDSDIPTQFPWSRPPPKNRCKFSDKAIQAEVSSADKTVQTKGITKTASTNTKVVKHKNITTNTDSNKYT